MSDEGEKTCPLCAEEMDLTDQQLKPCRCGYEICVYCWHHIIEMAEKNETEGRCPSCRTEYDKEKIVGAASKCERLAAEISMEKKKSQKSKTKTSEGRKQLSSVRVIRRNLVYIVGLPLYLADEDLLLHKEYFGQYGKVLKVSISRTSAGAIQEFANNTCSVYITYSKGEEAVRCIQSIDGFTLEGRSLRACFGTTKYCHAWLRNVPCTNVDCLYLHEIGSQEYSFSKDEIISAYSSGVQEITGIANSGQKRSGNVLPPPADEYCNNSSTTPGKLVAKSTPINLGSSARVSPPTSSAGRTGSLPAAASWGSRGSNFQTSMGGVACSDGPVKQKPDAASVSLTFSAPAAGVTQTSAQSTGLGKKVKLNADRARARAEEDASEHAIPKHRSKKVKFADKVTVFQETDKEKEENCGKWFTKEEDELLKKAVEDYIEANQLGEEGLSMVLTCGSHKKIRDCWKHIAAALPWRTVSSIYHRGHTLLEQGDREKYTEDQVEFIREFHNKHGADWKTAAEEMGKYRIHVKDAFRRHKLLNRNKGQWSQDEYQKLFELVNKDMQMRVFEERKSKHGMLKDNISWEAISDKLGTRNNIGCLQKWYQQLTSPMVAQGEWADVDDYWLVMELVDLDASCEDEVDWDCLLEHRSGDICRKRWLQMVRHLGEHGNKSFSEQVEVLSNRYCPDLLETRKQLDARPYVD